MISVNGGPVFLYVAWIVYKLSMLPRRRHPRHSSRYQMPKTAIERWRSWRWSRHVSCGEHQKIRHPWSWSLGNCEKITTRIFRHKHISGQWLQFIHSPVFSALHLYKISCLSIMRTLCQEIVRSCYLSYLALLTNISQRTTSFWPISSTPAIGSRHFQTSPVDRGCFFRWGCFFSSQARAISGKMFFFRETGRSSGWEPGSWIFSVDFLVLPT